MATYHCSIKSQGRGKAAAHCEYILREGKYGLGTMKEELAYKEEGNLPSWAEDAKSFFKGADEYERKGGTTYTEFEVALPTELSLEENKNLVKSFVEKHVGANKAYCFAIHEKMAAMAPDKRQPHAHIMFSERVMSRENGEQMQRPAKFFARYNPKNPEKGGCRKDDRFTKYQVGAQTIRKIREDWEKAVNQAYEEKGLEERVTAKRLEEQGQESGGYRRPQVHLGPKLANKAARTEPGPEGQGWKVMSEKAFLNFLRRELNKMEEMEKARPELEAELAKTKEGARTETQQLIEEARKELVIVQGSTLQLKIYGALGDIRNMLNENKGKMDETARKIVSEQNIRKAAVSAYTKGASTKIDKEEKRLEEIKAAYEKEKADYDAGKYGESKTLKAREELARLEKWKKDLDVRSKELQASKAWLEKELAKPERQEQIEKLCQMIAERNQVLAKTLNSYKQQHKELNALGGRLSRLIKGVDKRGRYRVEAGTTGRLGTKDAGSIKQAARSIEAAANKLRDAKEQGRGSQKAGFTLNRDDDKREGMDIGI